jgi:autotransporter passenger strand-loop-strand repeat protein
MPEIISGGQTDSVTSGQIDSGDVVLSGGSMFGLSGGEADPTTVAGGGSLTISAGATDSVTPLAGTEVIGGLDIAATISSGATMEVTCGGTAGPAIGLSGGTLIVNAGGVVSNATVIEGGTEIVSAGGEVGCLVLGSSGGIAGSTRINSGGFESGGREPDKSTGGP